MLGFLKKKQEKQAPLNVIKTGILEFDKWSGGLKEGQVIRVRQWSLGIDLFPFLAGLMYNIGQQYRVLNFQDEKRNLPQHMKLIAYGEEPLAAVSVEENEAKAIKRVLPWIDNIHTLHYSTIDSVSERIAEERPYVVIFNNITDRASFYKSCGFRGVKYTRPEDFKELAANHRIPVIIAGQIDRLCEADFVGKYDLLMTVRRKGERTESSEQHMLYCEDRQTGEKIDIPLTYNLSNGTYIMR